jgi:hypothetical protein
MAGGVRIALVSLFNALGVMYRVADQQGKRGSTKPRRHRARRGCSAITVCSALALPASLIEPSLQSNSPENGNINYLTKRIRPADGHRRQRRECERIRSIPKGRQMERILRVRGGSIERSDCLAGAGGFEPPNGGIKNRSATLIS